MAQLGMAELQKGTHSLVAMAQDAGERAQQARAEALELLKWVQNSWSQLEGMEMGHGGAGMGWDKGQVGGSESEQGWYGRVRAGVKVQNRGQMLIRVRVHLGLGSELRS